LNKEVKKMTVRPEYIIDENSNKKAVILQIEDWNKLLEEIEELEDIRAYDEAKSKDEELISFDDAVKYFCNLSLNRTLTS
jgi:PHD/YefM family antitoxin component YafN of YafNO toxin-antitoxin module